MRIMVTGATGFIGSQLIQFLLAAGCDVVACARNVSVLADRFPGLPVIRMDFTDLITPAEWAGHLQGIDVVVNTVGIFAEHGKQTFTRLHVEFPHKLFLGCEQAGVRRVIHISALGAEAGAVSKYHQSKFRADAYLRSLDLEHVIVKPSFVYGPNGKSTAFFRALAAQPLQVLVDGGRQLIQPIHVDDLCMALVILVRMAKVPLQELEAVGPAPLSFRDMLAAYRHWLGFRDSASGRANKRSPWTFRTMSIPMPLAMMFARLAGTIRTPWLSSDNLRMLQQGNTGDDHAISGLLGREPIAFAEALRRSPATEADRWYARLWFLLPLLRVAIGFVWLFSGVTSAFVYPASDSYAMLEQLGLRGWFATVSLYGAALLDILLGVAVLCRFQVVLTGLLQLGVILVYTALITLYLPEFWFHPFGPIIKNIPFMVGILILMAVERK